MKQLIASLFVFAGVALASNTPSAYHDGALVSFSMPSSGSACPQGSDDKACDESVGQYTVKSEGMVYVLTPVISATSSLARKATFGLAKSLGKRSSLYHALPGTPLQLRDDGKHVFVKVGDRQSTYTAVELH